MSSAEELTDRRGTSCFYVYPIKRSLSVATLVLLLSGTLLTPALATVPGSKCSVPDKKVRLGSMLLVCKKNAKGIKVWTRAAPGTPKPVSTPTPTSTTSQPSSKIGKPCDQYLSVTTDASGPIVCAQVGYFELKWKQRSPALSLPAKTAFHSVSDKKNTIVIETPVALSSSQTMSPERVTSLNTALSIVGDFWRDVYRPTTKHKMALVTEKDREFYLAFLQASTLSAKQVNDLINDYDRVTSGGPQSTGAGVFGDDSYGYFLWGSGAAAGQHAGWVSVAAHEWTHVVQSSVFGWQRMPCWFVEGQAAYYGIALGAKDEAQFQDLRQEFLNQNYDIDIRKAPQEGWRVWLDARDNPYNAATCGRDGAYPVGLLATEYMLSLKGHEGAVKFMKLRKDMPWKDSLTAVFGMSWPTFVEGLVAYLSEEMSKLPR